VDSHPLARSHPNRFNLKTSRPPNHPNQLVNQTSLNLRTSSEPRKKPSWIGSFPTGPLPMVVLMPPV
jgi:hypothetical protein